MFDVDDVYYQEKYSFYVIFGAIDILAERNYLYNSIVIYIWIE